MLLRILPKIKKYQFWNSVAKLSFILLPLNLTKISIRMITIPYKAEIEISRQIWNTLNSQMHNYKNNIIISK